MSRSLRYFGCLSALLFLTVLSPLARASMMGDTVTCKDLSTVSGLQCDAASATVGGGAEFTMSFNGGRLVEDFSATGVELTFTGNNYPFSFTDIENTDLSTSITGYTVNGISGFSGLTASAIALKDGKLDIDLVGSRTVSDVSTVNIRLLTAPAPVPEPSSLALLGTGLAAGATMLRRRCGGLRRA